MNIVGEIFTINTYAIVLRYDFFAIGLFLLLELKGLVEMKLYTV